MKNWMKRLAWYYQKTRDLYPEQKLLLVFDIDGTILDMRYMIFRILKLFDRSHSTTFFKDLKLSDINVNENQVEELLAQLKMPGQQSKKIYDWYLEHRWSSTSILESHRPFSGVVEVIRWFQIQPNTHVGLNTGRPESIRTDTLRSLNKLGEEYKVSFTDDLLYMNPYGWDMKVSEGKVAGLRHFQKAGYRIFAFVDNEPENLKAVSEIDEYREILLLHANTIFESKRKRLPSSTMSGKVYDITELIPERALPSHVQFVWHGANDEANLRQFLASNIHWAEYDVRMDPDRDNLILRHDSFERTPMQEDEEFLLLEHILKLHKKMDKSLKLDLKEGGLLIDKIVEVLKASGFDSSQLWFNGNVEVLQEDGFHKLAKAYPRAIKQCPIDFLTPIILSVPDKAKEMLDIFRGWGINRFSVNWETPYMRQLLDQIDKWGFEVNLYNIPDLQSFLKAVLLLPRSITSDFNFPKWHYYGRGAGENLKHYEYSTRRSP